MAEGMAPSKILGVAKTVGGVALTAVGIPMLILPGPGVLTVAGGVALTGKGLTDLTGNEKPGQVADYTVELAKETMELSASVATNTVAPAAKKAATSASLVALSAGKAAVVGAAKLATSGIDALQKRISK